ncbi:MAG: Na+/H+ antiporter NhaC family protein [Hyphomicrobiales bacterium]
MSLQKQNKGNPFALLPLVVFIVIFLLSSTISGDFYKMPVVVAFLISTFVALAMNRKVKFSEKVENFSRGAGNPSIMMMCMIFVLAGAFAQICRDMGAIESTVNIGLKFMPESVLVAGMFIISCFISISVGTSVGTIVAVAPMAVSLSQTTDLSVGLTVGAVVGGAMFGDNLSFISDTTIASTRTQGCSMKDKFRMNFKIVLPAAIISVFLYAFATHNGSGHFHGALHYNWLKTLPYIGVLIVALIGVNVFIVLSGGIIFAAVLGLILKSFDVWQLVSSIAKGIAGMSELIIICLLIGGIVELIRQNGGIDWVLYTINRKVKNKKAAELGIASLISFVNICTANNTIAIIITGPISKQIADKYKIKGARSASILDTFSCLIQGIIPYGAQILAAVSVASSFGIAITPTHVMSYLYYPYLMGFSALMVILFSKSSKNKIHQKS